MFLRQTGQTVAEFSDALGRQFGDAAAPQPAAAETEAGTGELEPGT